MAVGEQGSRTNDDTDQVVETHSMTFHPFHVGSGSQLSKKVKSRKKVSAPKGTIDQVISLMDVAYFSSVDSNIEYEIPDINNKRKCYESPLFD